MPGDRTETIFINDVGEVELRKSHIAKRVSIRISPIKGVEIIYPNNLKKSKAIKFAEENNKWILKHKNKIEKVNRSKLLITEDILNITKFHSLTIKRNSSKTSRIHISSNQILVSIPIDEDIKNEIIQNNIRSAVVFAMKLDAKRYLPKRLSYLSQKHSLPFNNLTIRNQKTRWGSCSSLNNINLSIQLMQLPDELIDYVLLHELAHTIHKNHGSEFWKFLNGLCDDNAKTYRAELRKYCYINVSL